MNHVHCQGLEAWNRAAAQAFGDIAVASPASHFEATMSARQWPGVQLMQLSSPAARVRGAHRRGRAGWYLLCNRSGCVSVYQAGRCIVLDEGELSLLRADLPYDISFDSPNQMLVAALPLLNAPTALQRRLMLRHGRDESAVIAALLQRVQAMDSRAAATLDAQALRAALLQLLLLARPEPAGDDCGTAAAAGSPAAGWLPRIASEVERNLHDPQLDGARIAAALGMSPRYLQRLMESQGSTLSAFILERRLEWAAAALRQQPQRRIAELAFDAGFGDLSYFCRAFRRRFGCSARQWRSLN